MPQDRLETGQGVPGASKRCSLPRAPRQGAQSTPSLAHLPASPFSTLALHGALAFLSRQQEGLPRPLPKSSVGLGYSDSAQRNVTGAGAGGGFKGRNCAGEGGWGLELGGMGESGEAQAAGPWWVPQRCPRVPAGEDRLSPQPPPAVAGPGRSHCNHGLINALGNFTVWSWLCSS